MQLSFSIDAILGNKSSDGGEPVSTVKHQEKSPSRERTPSSKKDNRHCSPRSHTIEWKPPGEDYSFPKVCKPPPRNENDINDSVASRKLVLRSPPNARVVPGRKNTIDHNMLPQKENNNSPAKTSNMKTHQMHSRVPTILPYPAEMLRKRGIHHHPHHYPYQLPYVGHEGHWHTKTFPGLFSPHYSLQGKALDRNTDSKFNVNDTISLSENATSQSSVKYGSYSRNTASDRPTSDHPEAAEENVPDRKQMDNIELKDKRSYSDSEINNHDEMHRRENKKKRVGRRLFTGFQILELEKAFSVKPYLNRMERAFISQKVNLTECQIKTWFQNRRTKEKRRGIGSEDEDGKSRGLFSNSIPRSQSKPLHIPGYGVQLAATYGPPDHHLQVAIENYLKKKKSSESPNIVSSL